MNFVQSIISDLRTKRLWPLAVALLLALVAVPVLLSSKAASVPIARTTPPFNPVSTSGVPIPTLTIEPPPTLSRLNEAPHDPFIQQAAASAPASTSTSASPSTSSVASSLANAGSASGPSGAGSTGGSSPAGGGSSSTPTSTPPLAPVPPSSLSSPPASTSTGLTDTESYHVALSITNASGGLEAIDPLERLSVLPSNSSPLLVELGVLKGGNRVLFTVQPGTVVNGPGVCTPGPIDCEILSLAPNQVEQASLASGSDVVPVALFAVTGITIDEHSTVAAANQARSVVSAAGSSLLSTSKLSALPLFQYDPNVGAVVDLRDLTIGGN